MPQVTATMAHRYGSKQHKAGDTYQIRDEHLRLYTALGWISAATPAPAPHAPATEAVAAPVAPFKRGPGRPRKDERRDFGGTYSRRDLVAAPPAVAPDAPTDEAE